MNVFEDLVIELQKENLLEKPAADEAHDADEDTSHLDETVVPNKSYDVPEYGVEDDAAADIEYVHAIDEQSEAEVVAIEAADEEASIHETIAAPMAMEQAQDTRPTNNTEFFKKRAMGEVSSLQMVEHVVTGVEREYLRVVPKPFDDFNAKKSLHSFLQVDESVNSEEHATAEFTLMQETEAWCSALATRDRDIPVSSLRQYCESSRPALSSQALLALARFYRNLPYSEPVRAKFDFVITRLFTRASGIEKRVCLFSRDETLNHINTLYSDWSSIPLYAADDDESKVMLTALSFEDLSIEAENASTFDQLIESDFFGRLRMFKESVSELFYAPQVTAAAIECNIRIGNAYVELIDRERRKLDAPSVQSKYGDLNDQTISEATGQTLQLVDLLRELSQGIDETETESVQGEYQTEYEPLLPVSPDPKRVKKKDAGPSFLARMKANAFSVNRWFLAVAILLISASIGLYVWANYYVSDNITTAGVKVVSVETSNLKDFVKTARVSGEIFYAQMLPSWDRLSKEKRQEFLQLVLKVAREKGCNQVNLISSDGKMVGYASPTRLEVVDP